MIFNTLTLINIGSFHGRHEVNLSPPGKEKPIVLIGALNGSGKTTILDAMQVGLYGRRAKSLVRVKSGYDDYLKQLVNRKARPSEGAQIELSFQIDDSGATQEYRIVRSWQFKTSRPVECLDIYVNGVYDAVLSENWEEEVERFIPWNLAHLFFFDGERIEALADPSQSADILRTGIQSLLGIELVDQLRSDLDVYRRRKQKAVATPVDQKRIEDLELQISKVSESRKRLIEKRSQTNNDLTDAKKQLDAANMAFEKQGGQLFEDRKLLETNQIEVAAELRRVDGQLRELVANALPLTLVTDQLKRLSNNVKAGRHAKQAQFLADGLSEHNRKLIKWISAQNNSDKSTINDLTKFLDKELAKVTKRAETRPIVDLTDNAVAQLQNLLNSGFKLQIDSTKLLADERDELVKKIDDIERSLSKVPEESIISSYIEKRAKSESNWSHVSKQFDEIEEQLRASQFERDTLKRELDQLSEAAREVDIENEENQRLADYSKKVQGVLEKLGRQTLVTHIQALEEHISVAFKVLMRKSTLIETINIDPDTFRVSIYSQVGAKLSPELLSAGERQLLAIALLWGLGRAAGRKLPIVIDTPLGRLDSVHRRNLVEKYFPEASHQVILLSTDEEIDEEFSNDLDDSIAHRYLLDYDDVAESTSIRDGYFWEHSEQLL